jgi:hypothetical protein
VRFAWNGGVFSGIEHATRVRNSLTPPVTDAYR